MTWSVSSGVKTWWYCCQKIYAYEENMIDDCYYNSIHRCKQRLHMTKVDKSQCQLAAPQMYSSVFPSKTLNK